MLSAIQHSKDEEFEIRYPRYLWVKAIVDISEMQGHLIRDWLLIFEPCVLVFVRIKILIDRRISRWLNTSSNMSYKLLKFWFDKLVHVPTVFYVACYIIHDCMFFAFGVAIHGEFKFCVSWKRQTGRPNFLDRISVVQTLHFVISFSCRNIDCAWSFKKSSPFALYCLLA